MGDNGYEIYDHNRFCSDWHLCIGHGIRVAARTFVTFVKEGLKCFVIIIIGVSSDHYSGQ